MTMSDTEQREDLLRELISARRKAKQRQLGQMVLARDEERRRIADEIHRAPLQAMYEVAEMLEGLRSTLEPDAAAEMRELQGAVEQATHELRDLVFELSLVPVEQEGLAGAVRALMQRIKDETGVHYRLENRMWAEPPSEARTTIYRIVEEALTNVRRHAEANNVEVRLESGEGYRVRVEDDGVGFIPEHTPPPPDRLGITLMRQRAEAAGGWFHLESAPAQGTVVEFALPARPDEVIAERR